MPDWNRDLDEREGVREQNVVQDNRGPGSEEMPRGPSFRGRGPKNFRRSDERLRELVSERLEDHEAIDATDMEVAVSSGVVTLTGAVDSRRTRRLAEDVALITPGVVSVQNALEIDPGFFGRMAERVREAVQGE